MISLKTIKRVVILVVGSTVLAIGVALLVLPGPAFIVIPAGLAILAVEFAWARRWLRKARNLLPNKNGAGDFTAFVTRHAKNFLEWASVRPRRDSKRQKEQKDKKMKTGNEVNQPPAADHASKDEVARRAYELYETRGKEPGHELEDWLHAEQEVNTRRQLLHTEG
jgi:Putative transmembrane protein (PGPGW)/Protein of unknown function (DUF2934)